MFAFAVAVAATPLIVGLYAYVGYPAILWLIVRMRPSALASMDFGTWPTVTITVPVYNGVASIRTTLERLTELDYPSDRLQLLVLSDASTDGTDDVVREFASRGVELLRAPERSGKTAAENAAVSRARGEIIVNVDATVAVPRTSLKWLVRAFSDPSVGVASGRDVSVDPARRAGTSAEASYVGYEMWVRGLETRAGSIVGASGCFFGIRRNIHAEPLPPELSWDFASTLVARQRGYRSVSVPEAVCIVPRTGEIRTELRRKARTMARGLSTLFYFRALMNPFRYGAFAWMLISHKLLRWIPYLLAPFATLALAALAPQTKVASGFLGLVLLGSTTGITAMRRKRSGVPKIFALAGFVMAAFTAGFLAWYDALTGTRTITWSPTTRPDASAA